MSIGSRFCTPNGKGTRYLSIPDVNGTQSQRSWPEDHASSLLSKKLMVHRHMDDEKFVTRFSGAQLLVFEFQSAACLFSRFLDSETKNPQRRAKTSITEDALMRNDPGFGRRLQLQDHILAADKRGITRI
jgi:hypothetical protein